jgi:tRNA pseudouridine38-40 synthase
MSEAEPGLHGVRLVVAYDGTDFAGWQEQPAQRTVQSVLERAISEMSGHVVKVRGAGRTDAGVHAEGQVAAFDSARLIAPRGWMLGLNRLLPDDVAVRAAVECAPGYNPRYDALDKVYRYVLLLGEARDPHWRIRAWHVARVHLDAEGSRRLDLDALRAGAERLVGTHDFGAFRAGDDERTMTVRTLYEVQVIHEYLGNPDLLAIEVRGSAFLKQMMRILVGTLLEVGRGKRTPESLTELLAPGAARGSAGITAPAHGLTMVRVRLGKKDAERAPGLRSGGA